MNARIDEDACRAIMKATQKAAQAKGGVYKAAWRPGLPPSNKGGPKDLTLVPEAVEVIAKHLETSGPILRSELGRALDMPFSRIDAAISRLKIQGRVEVAGDKSKEGYFVRYTLVMK